MNVSLVSRELSYGFYWLSLYNYVQRLTFVNESDVATGSLGFKEYVRIFWTKDQNDFMIAKQVFNSLCIKN